MDTNFQCFTEIIDIHIDIPWELWLKLGGLYWATTEWGAEVVHDWSDA